MKKFYLTLILLVTGFTYGQNVLKNGGFETWKSTIKPDGWTHVENITQESTEKHGGTYSAKHESTTKTKDLGQTISSIIPGDTYVLTINYKVKSGDGTDARIWSKWKSNAKNLSDYSKALLGPANKYLDNNSNRWATYTVTMKAPSTATDFYFEVRTYKGAVVYWDDFSFIHKAPTTPTLSITAPTENQVFSPEVTKVDVTFVVQNFKVANGTGDGHISWKLDSGTATAKYDTKPINLTSLSAGTHTVDMELVDNSGNPLSPAVKKTVHFTTETYTQVANLATLRAKAVGKYYKVTGEVYVIGGEKTSSGILKGYVQDDTAGIMIYDSEKVLTTQHDTYDGLTGIKGKLVDYNGVLELKPTADTGAATSTGHVITPQEITASEFKTNHEKYESELIKINNATANYGKDTKYTYGRSYELTDASGKTVFRVAFKNLAGKAVKTGKIDVTGIGSEYKGGAQIFPREENDIISSTSAINENDISGFNVYPNPVVGGEFYISSDRNLVKQVKVFDLLGKMVLSVKVDNAQAIQVSDLVPGIYFLEVKENKNTAYKKIIIK